MSLAPSSSRARLVLGALAAVLVVALAYVAGYLTPRFTTPGDNSAEAGFARDMSVHHGQAVEMGMYAFQRGQDAQVRILGYDIATSQQYQIGQMQRWLQEWHLTPTGDDPRMSWMPGGEKELSADGLMPGMATNADMDKLKASTGKNFDILFCQLMVRHHLGGVHMAQEILKMTDRTEVTDLASAIEQNQKKEINILNELLKQLGVNA